MPGLYFHIPFCRKACHYCNFHFSTSLQLRVDFLAALHQEIILRKDETRGQQSDTIYFGGGTPSLLSSEEIRSILDLIRLLYNIGPNPEITLEANPDDLTLDYLMALKSIGINRLSIGIQSFQESDLQFMNRNHDATQARSALNLARSIGFSSINADLIYGTPGMTDEAFLQNIRELVNAGVDHISAYALTVEPKTALAHFVKTGTAPAPDDDQSALQFQLLKRTLAEAGFDHYEISNWALPGRYSRHNTSYWQGVPYIGFGPSAHSFDGISRSWNVAHNPNYIKALLEGQLPSEKEILSATDHYNEYVLTRLRTTWGCIPTTLAEPYRTYFVAAIDPFIQEGMVIEQEGCFTLTEAGQLYADRISSSLFHE